MDIRYIIWAGYDFIGPEAISGFQGLPEMSGESQGNVRLSMDMSAPTIGPHLRSPVQSQPSVRAAQAVKPPTIKAEDLRPFPSPRNT